MSGSSESGWRLIFGSGSSGLAHNPKTLFRTSDSWPRKVITVKTAVIGPESHRGSQKTFIVLRTDGSVAVLEIRSGSKKPEWRSLECLATPKLEAVDLCQFLDSDNLVVVISSIGRAFLVNWKKDEIVQTLDSLKEQPGSPKRDKIGTNFKFCSSGQSHLVLVDHVGQAWSWGQGPQTGIVSNHDRASSNASSSSTSSPYSSSRRSSGHFECQDIELTRIDFFQGLRIVSIASGKDFNVALVEHENHCLASPVGSEDVVSPANDFRSSCPLGLPLELKKTEGSRKIDVSSLSEDVFLEEADVELRKKPSKEVAPCHSTSSNYEESLEETEKDKIERLTHSGLYLNPTDALKYLSNQLSWIGNKSNSDVEEAAHKNQDTSEIQEQNFPDRSSVSSTSAATLTNIYKATSAVADGVKYVGQTVSKLSYSFSTSTDKDTVVDTPEMDTETGVEELQLNSLTKPNDSWHSCEVTKSPPPLVMASTSSLNRSYPIYHRRSHSASVLDKIAETSSSTSSKSKPSSLNLSRVKPVKYEVWFWGQGHRGQAGQGDMLDRLQPCLIPSLTDIWIQKVTCADFHCLALTKTGRVYGWGENSSGQSSPKCKFKVCSTPSLIDLPVGETACDIAVAANSSFILTDCGSLYRIGPDHEGKRQSFLKYSLSDEENSVISRYIMGCDSFVCCFEGQYDLPVSNFKSMEKLFLLKLKEICFHVLEPLGVKPILSDQKLEVRNSLYTRLERLTEIVSFSVIASWNMARLEEANQISLIKDISAFEHAFTEYFQAFGDCQVSDALALDSQEFVKFSPVILDILQKQCHVDTSNLGQNGLSTLASNPIGQLKFYCDCLSSMAQAGRRQKSVRILRTCEVIENTISSLKALEKSAEKENKLMEETKKFWDLTGNKFSSLKTYQRRIILNSKYVPINLSNSGSFNKTWIILMNDVLIHAGFSSFVGHPLKTIWIESHSKQGEEKHDFNLLMPEENMTFVAPDPETKNEWFQSLQKAILESLLSKKESSVSKNISFTPPIIRKTRYLFHKITELKGAEYHGTWMQGKMHGQGTLTWSDGRIYRGQFRQNQKHGNGRLEVRSAQGTTVYDGQWKCDKFEGKGKILYPNGDSYEGMLKDGKPHGQGIFKQGKFMGSGASVYIGEWVGGMRQGYGVSDDIISGEKFMGMWSGDMKSGLGCVVTLDGVYYEGTFSHNKMTGKGLMLFEDETSYEGNFADAGVFSGHGSLSYENGDRLEGSFYGNYNDGMKFNGTIYKTPRNVNVNTCNNLISQNTTLNKEKIGKFSVDANQKWTGIFSHFHSLLCIQNFVHIDEDVACHSPAIWEQLAILINQAKNNIIARAHMSTQSNFAMIDVTDGLEMIPDYSSNELTSSYLSQVNDYLNKAFHSSLHPLHDLLTSLSDCFNSTYGGVRIHPRLLKHSVQELDSLVFRMYKIIRLLFPALPEPGDQVWLQDCPNNSSGEMVSASSIVLPHLLPNVHSSIFMLYALYYKKNDDDYWARILKWNKHPDIALLSFLDVNQKFWNLQEVNGRKSFSQIRDQHFSLAIETLQQIKTKFTPFEKMNVILETFREVNRIGQTVCGSNYFWSMDDLFPVFQYVVVRARILQLGAEIHMIEDLLESHLNTGEYGIMFTTLQASYYQILKESLSMV